MTKLKLPEGLRLAAYEAEGRIDGRGVTIRVMEAVVSWIQKNPGILLDYIIEAEINKRSYLEEK